MKPSIEQIASDIRRMFAADPLGAEEGIEDLLAGMLEGLDGPERLHILARLERLFSSGHDSAKGAMDSDFMASLVPLLLGRDIAAHDLTGQDVMQRLAKALNTVFTTLNELTGVINATLGGSPAGDETIRQIIGSGITEQRTGMSIEQYLGQIRKAFLAAQQASRDAARTMAAYILTELDPEAIQAASGGLRIGPLKKAEAFELFEERFKRVKKWHESERFLLDFLRQFEKNCQKSFT